MPFFAFPPLCLTPPTRRRREKACFVMGRIRLAFICIFKFTSSIVDKRGRNIWNVTISIILSKIEGNTWVIFSLLQGNLLEFMKFWKIVITLIEIVQNYCQRKIAEKCGRKKTMRILRKYFNVTRFFVSSARCGITRNILWQTFWWRNVQSKHLQMLLCVVTARANNEAICRLCESFFRTDGYVQHYVTLYLAEVKFSFLALKFGKYSSYAIIAKYYINKA